MKKNLFDKIAKEYYSIRPSIPQKYFNLLYETFQIEYKDHIIDLGCGSGGFAISFAKMSSFTEGIDSSRTMIEMAKRRDKWKRVKWIHKSVQDFDFGKENYNVIFSYESFHLFPDYVNLIQKCAKALKSGGYLGVGWAMYEFDLSLKNAIQEIFAKNDVSWKGWENWTCPDFPILVQETNVGLSEVHQKKLTVKSRISTKTIVNYFLSVSITASLNDKLREKMSGELWKQLIKIFPSGECVGYDKYSIMYCVKL